MKSSIMFCVAIASCMSFNAKAAKVDIDLPKGAKIMNVGTTAEFKTIEDALDRVKEIRKADSKTPLAICVAPGEYSPARQLKITKEHSTTNTAPLFIYAADFNKKPRIHGGDFVTGWAKTTFNGRSDIWVSDVSKIRTVNDPTQFRLSFNGKRQAAARFPNFNPDEPYTSGYAFASTNVTTYYDDEIKMRPQEFRKWAHPEDAMIVFCPRHSFDWRNSTIESISNDVIRLAKRKHKEVNGSWKWDRWCVYNMAEELDIPGEWYFDPRAKKIYMLTPDGSDPNKAVITVERPEEIVLFDKHSGNVSLVGLELTGGKYGSKLEDADDISFLGCSIHDVGGYGLYGGTGIFLYGRRTRIEDCDIFNTGSEGIVVHSHADDQYFDKRLGVVIKNCYIHHVGQLYPDGSAIFNCGQGVTITQNLIHDTPRVAICGYGRFCDISYNRIRHTNLMSSDTGALYDSYWTQGAGSKIRYNWITDTIGCAKKGEGLYAHRENACGIYFDECSGGTEVYGNLVQGAHWTAVMMHNARWVTVSNNVFVSNGWTPLWHYSHQFEISSWTTNNFGGSRRKMYSGGPHGLYKADPRWKTLPSLAQDPATDEVFSKNGAMTMGVKIVNNVVSFPDQHVGVLLYGWEVDVTTNKFDNNLYWPGEGKKIRSCIRVWHKEDTSWEAWLNEKGFDKNSLIADPLFQDPDNGNYRLKKESPAFKLGFTELPYEKMGLQVSKYRPILKPHAEGVREHPEWLTDHKGYYTTKKVEQSAKDEKEVHTVSPNVPVDDPTAHVESPNVPHK